jgi:multicomponent Na+:H+ antiporter subunit B
MTEPTTELIVIPILALLAATAVTVARIRNLWAAVMFTGIYSFLGASWMLILDAPDVAFTEAAVGAGISTILMLATLSLTPRRKHTGRLTSKDFQEKPHRFKLMPFFVVAVTGFALIYGRFDMPHFGDPDAPIQVYPDPSFVKKSQPDMHGLPNVVTAVLASYRGYDTLGETAVIFTAGIAVLLILRKSTPDDAAHEQAIGVTPNDKKEVLS